MTQDEKILLSFLSRVSKRMKDEQKKKGMRASGKSADSLKETVDQKGDLTKGTLTGAAYFEQQEEGRGPTPGNARKSTPTLKQAIRRWIDDKGIGASLSGKQKDGLAFVIARKIHREGWNKDGQRINTTKIIKEERKILISEANKSSVERFRSQLVKAFN